MKGKRMTADADGNDLKAVPIPVTGFLAVQLEGEPTYLESEALGVTPLVLPEGYQKAGLFSSDGGPQDGGDKEDDIEFFQDGYKLGGAKTRTLQVTLAELNDIVEKLITGKTPDENGVIVVDGDNDATFPGFEVIKYKNGDETRRNGLMRVSTVEPDQNERGSVNGNAVTFDWLRQAELGGFYREWRKNRSKGPANLSEPTTVAVTGVTLAPTTASVEVGKTTSLTATVAPADATEKSVTWKSSDEETATVDSSGKVTGVKAGTADITATTKSGAKTAKATLTSTGATEG
jgi:uncharacterized protein YjdB